MEMSFPHLNDMNGAPSVHRDFRALLSKAISRQGSSPTGRLMLAASRTQVAANANGIDALDRRIEYFAAALHPIDAETAPHGAFFPGKLPEISSASNYDQAVYHAGLGNGKDDAVNIGMSEAQTTLPGQEN